MSDILAPWQHQLESHFESAYRDNGPDHQISHFRDVYKTGVHINESLDLGYDPLAIMTVAYLHDLFAWSRDHHHTLAFTYVLETVDPLIVEILTTLKNREEYGYYQSSIDLSHRDMIAQACHEHRASFDGKFSHPFTELMNSANRGEPKGIKPIVERAYRYALAHNKDKTWPECIQIAVDHVKEKFSRTGYARIPDMYKLVYGDELNAIWDDVDILDEIEFMVNSLDHSEIIWY